MKILVVSDAWHPQINGVVRTLVRTTENLMRLGHHVCEIEPGNFFSVPTPFEPGLRAAITTQGRLTRLIEAHSPDSLHIATEGPLGWAARGAAIQLNMPFTTAYHTHYPDYLHMRMRVPRRLSFRVLRHFHSAAAATMVPTRSVRRILLERGFKNLRVWGRGVDTTEFTPGLSSLFDNLPRPVYLNVGRVSPEKNLPAFLGLDLPGSKVVIGDGPQLAELRRRYPDVHFLGAKSHDQLPGFYRAADVFVFPSKTDTFGLVLLEAMACGLPVAAFPVPGPIDVVRASQAGVLDRDLQQAAIKALSIDSGLAARHAAMNSWELATERFESFLVPARDAREMTDINTVVGRPLVA